MGEAEGMEGNIGCHGASAIGEGECLSVGSGWSRSFAALDVAGAG
jgi:hypothetical protein